MSDTAPPSVPTPSRNGHRPEPPRPRAVSFVRGAPAAAIVGTLVAVTWVPRIEWLNLSLLAPWLRIAVVAVLAGFVAGLLRPAASGARRSAVAGAAAAVTGVWLAYAGVRLSVTVLWIERNAARVVAADLARLAAYAAVPGALGASGGALARTALRRVRNRLALSRPPIRRL